MSRNAHNGEFGENLKEVTRGAPYKVEKVMKMANLAKMHHGFDKYTNRMPKVAPWRVAILAKMAILTKIRLRCSETCNELLKGAPSLVTNLTKKFAISTCTSPIIHLICPSKFCTSFVFHFSWVLQPSQEEFKAMRMQHFGGQMRCIMGDVQVANIWVS